MRIFFLPRKVLAVISLVVTLAALGVVVQVLTANEYVSAWVETGFVQGGE